jgi:hypothetical protein
MLRTLRLHPQNDELAVSCRKTNVKYYHPPQSARLSKLHCQISLVLRKFLMLRICFVHLEPIAADPLFARNPFYPLDLEASKGPIFQLFTTVTTVSIKEGSESL